jgi:diguanylate cyclase (GGDEF)-like protein
MSEDPLRTVALRLEGRARGEAGAAVGFLTVIRGSDHDLGRYLVIDRPVTIGRGEGADLRLRDHGVSRVHARIEPDAQGGCTLADLGSTNGTFVGSRHVAEHVALRDGDKIFLGESVLRFAIADDLDLGYQTEVAQILGTDPLTGLESKRRFDDALAFALESVARGDRALVVFMMDMDGVKGINDTHGHAFGAHVIGETGRLIAGRLGASGHACRFGGDEFCAFVPGLDMAAALDVAESIRRAVEDAGMQKDGIALAPTISIGVAASAGGGETLAELVARADAALYRAKSAGKNRTAV